MAGDIDRAGVAKAYGRWAPIYDLVFGKVFDHGRQSTIAEADKIGGRIQLRIMPHVSFANVSGELLHIGTKLVTQRNFIRRKRCSL